MRETLHSEFTSEAVKAIRQLRSDDQTDAFCTAKLAINGRGISAWQAGR
jgi:hypothetical protein